MTTALAESTTPDDPGPGSSPPPVVDGTFDGPPAVRSMQAIGTTAVVAVTDSRRADEALALLAEDLSALDRTCSRFRPDSELRRLEEFGRGRPVAVSPLLFEAIDVACRVAVQTAGIVDPTIGSALIELGYDRDFDELGSAQGRAFEPRPAPGWWQIVLDPMARTVSVPEGVHVDLGATAKALAADRAATRLAFTLGGGVLVNLGGDVAVAGTGPDHGWAVGIASECTTDLARADQVVSIVDGGLATSGTTARTWIRNGRRVHHIVDPWTGEAAEAVWSLVSVVAPTCVEANAWSTAAVVWGHDAVGNLEARGVPARLVDATGSVTTCGNWPKAPDPVDAGPTTRRPGQVG
jgi:thiamine biosynthesis lipoprotein